MRKIILAFLIFAVSSLLFAQSADYKKFMTRAKSYEEKNYWIFAMADYYQAMEAEPTELAEDAYNRFYEILNAIREGKPAPDDALKDVELDEFEIHDRWAFLYKEYNSYWSKHSPVSFSFDPWHLDQLDYETKTAQYSSSVYVNWSKMFKLIKDSVSRGYNIAYRSDWIDLSVSWTGDVKELSSYSLIFNLCDKDGNLFLENQELKRNGYSKVFIVSGVPKKLMKQFDENQIQLSLENVTVHGEPTKISLKDIYIKFPDGTGHLDEEINLIVSEKVAQAKIKQEEERKEKEFREQLALGQEEFKKKSPKMIKIEAGSFVMGIDCPEMDEKNSYKGYSSPVNLHPAHKVNLAGYKISATEVTQKKFQEVMGYNPSVYINEKNPVENLSWYEAIAFCNKASLIKGLKPCYSINGETNPDLWEKESSWYSVEITHPYDESYEQKRYDGLSYIGKIKCDFNKNGYRLPTEAEWEYAAKEGNLNSEYIYSGSDVLIEVAWCNSNCTEPHGVAKRLPNALGLYDMTGNVAEWCWDIYDEFYYEYSTDNNPLGPESRISQDGVIKGGSYKKSLKISNRDFFTMKGRFPEIGFRIVQSTEKRVWNDPTPDEKVADKVEAFLKNGPSMNLVKSQINYTNRIVGGETVPVDVPFYLGRYEVSQYEWKAIMGNNPSKFSYNLENPVEGVDYYDCLYFCNKLSERFGYIPCYEIDGNINADQWDFRTVKENTKSSKVTCNFKANGFRLPTEEEYKALGVGREYTDGVNKGWTYYNSRNRTHPCGTMEPNFAGVYDLQGNVCEMCFGGDILGTSIYPNRNFDYYSKSSDRTVVGFRLARTYVEE